MSVCATCLQPGLPDGGHDCPGLGDIQLTRQLGHGVRVDTAPARAQMALNVLTEHGWGAALVGADQVNIADQALYQVVGYDAESAALILELAEDWRTSPAATVRSLPERELHDAIRKMARIDPDWFRGATQAMDRIGQAENVHAVLGGIPPARDIEGTTVCTPIPAETLTRMSEVPAELLTEQQRTRADNAEARLRLVREALVRDGYFTADEVGDDIAPRITELATVRELAARGFLDERDAAQKRARQAEAELTRLHAGEEHGWDPLTVPTPGQWIARFNQASAEERLDVARRVIGYTATAGECFEMNHVRRLEEDRQAWATVARVTGLRDSWLLMTLEPGQVRRLLDAVTRALEEPEEPGAAEPPSGFVPFARPEHIAQGETSGDPLVVEPYRNDRGESAWVFRCWGASTCDGWLSLDHYTQESAERARDRHAAERHPEEPLPMATNDRREVVADTIRRFPFDDYGLDSVSYLLEESPDTQEWVAALADAIVSALGQPKGQTAPSPKGIAIDPPDGSTILAARHLDATEGPVQVGAFVNTATRSAITTVLRYIAKAHNSPAVLTDADGRTICTCTYDTPCGCGTSVHYTSREQPMPDGKPDCTATIEGPHVLGGGPVQCTREAGHPENHVGPRMGDAGKTLWTDHHAGATPHRAPAEGESTP